jgi:hypothetical protein
MTDVNTKELFVCQVTTRVPYTLSTINYISFNGNFYFTPELKDALLFGTESKAASVLSRFLETAPSSYIECKIVPYPTPDSTEQETLKLQGKQMPSDEPLNPWKETVRTIFDKIELESSISWKLVIEILNLIETNHPEYFCEKASVPEKGETTNKFADASDKYDNTLSKSPSVTLFDDPQFHGKMTGFVTDILVKILSQGVGTAIVNSLDSSVPPKPNSKPTIKDISELPDLIDKAVFTPPNMKVGDTVLYEGKNATVVYIDYIKYMIGILPEGDTKYVKNVPFIAQYEIKINKD